MKKFAVLTAILALSITATSEQKCKGNSRVVSACFTVHGRYSFYNGNPSYRIWVTGTHQVLGVKDDEDPIVPRRLLQYPADIYGDFEICPFTKPQLGHMQMVCVESVKKIVDKSE